MKVSFEIENNELSTIIGAIREAATIAAHTRNDAEKSIEINKINNKISDICIKMSDLNNMLNRK